MSLHGGSLVDNGGASLILRGKGNAPTNGWWNITANDGTKQKTLLGTLDELRWGGERVLTQSDLERINNRLTELELLIGKINTVLEANVGG